MNITQLIIYNATRARLSQSTATVQEQRTVSMPPPAVIPILDAAGNFVYAPPVSSHNLCVIHALVDAKRPLGATHYVSANAKLL